MKSNIFFTVFAVITLFVLGGCSKYTKPKVSEIHIVTKGAGLGQTGGGVIPQSFISPMPYNVAGQFEKVSVEKAYYTPIPLVKQLPVTMERDDNVQVSFTSSALFSLNAEQAHVTVVKFKNYKYEMERILGKVMQYKLSKKSFGFKQVVSSDEDLSIEELEKMNDFSDRVSVADELREAFIVEFNKSFPDFLIVDMQQLPESKQEREKVLSQAAFYFNGLALISIDIDTTLTKPFERIAVSQYRTKKAELMKEIKNTQGKIKVQQSENLAAGIRLEAQSVTNELMTHLSREVVLQAVENPDVSATLFVEINPDMSINFDSK